MVTVSFTGHRPKELFGTYDSDNPKAHILARELTKEIERLIVEEEADKFVSGGALGVDQIAFICVHMLKKKYPHIQNILAIPYKNQTAAWEESLEKAKRNGWTKAIKDLELTLKRYAHILSVSDERIYVDTIPKYQPKNMKPEDIDEHSNAKLQMRNIYMLDQCNVLVAVYNGSGSGGTYNCVKAAKEKGLRIIYLDPNQDFIKKTDE